MAKFVGQSKLTNGQNESDICASTKFESDNGLSDDIPLARRVGQTKTINGQIESDNDLSDNIPLARLVGQTKTINGQIESDNDFSDFDSDNCKKDKQEFDSSDEVPLARLFGQSKPVNCKISDNCSDSSDDVPLAQLVETKKINENGICWWPFKQATV